MPNQATYTDAHLARLKQSGRLWLAVHRESGRVDDTGHSFVALRYRWPLHSHRIDHVEHCGVAL